MTGDVNEFIGSAKARLHALEQRAEKWDEAIGTLKAFQAKISVLGVIAMLLTSFLMNYLIKIMGLS